MKRGGGRCTMDGLALSQVNIAPHPSIPYSQFVSRFSARGVVVSRKGQEEESYSPFLLHE